MSKTDSTFHANSAIDRHMVASAAFSIAASSKLHMLDKDVELDMPNPDAEFDLSDEDVHDGPKEMRDAAVHPIHLTEGGEWHAAAARDRMRKSDPLNAEQLQKLDADIEWFRTANGKAVEKRDRWPEGSTDPTEETMIMRGAFPRIPSMSMKPRKSPLT